MVLRKKSLTCKTYKKKGGFFRMKKIVMGIAAIACAATMFAVDISSTVKMNADIVRKSGDNVEFFAVNKQGQKDNDALIFSANGEKAGEKS